MLTLPLVLLLLLLLLDLVCAALPFESSQIRVRGVTLGAGAFGGSSASAASRYGNGTCTAAAQRLVAMGATHVQLIVPLWVNATASPAAAYAIADASSPLRTPTAAEIAACAQALALASLKPVVQLTVLPDYSVPGLCRDPLAACFADPATIGSGLPAGAAAFVLQLQSLMAPYVRCAAAANAVLELAGNDVLLLAAPTLWTAFIASARSAGVPQLMASFALPSSVHAAPTSAWASGDLIGVSAQALRSFSSTPARNSTVRAQEPTWAAAAIVGAKMAARLPAPVTLVVSPLMVQSRPGCENGAPFAVRPGQDDCSAWLECYDMACQSNAYEAFLRQMTPFATSWFGGVFSFLVRVEPSNGGTSDSDWTVAGKPAEQVLRRWFGGNTDDDDDASLIDAAISAAHERNLRSPLIAANRFGPPQNFSTRGFTNGFVFGGPAEWSYPGDRFDSSNAARSIDAMVRETNANAIEIPVMWFYDTANATDFYPKFDLGSTLRTSTDEELGAVVRYAKSRNLRTCLTPMLDPDFELPDRPRIDNATGFPGWRGRVGNWWGTNCSPGTPWHAWHENYRRWTLHYARLAQKLGIDEFLLTHELQAATPQCATTWQQLVKEVRGVYSGVVGTAFNWPVVSFAPAVAPWASMLDYIGVDCYFSLAADLSSVTKPWDQVPLATIQSGWTPYIGQLQALSGAVGNLPIRCTEIGYQSRSQSYSTNAASLPKAIYTRNHQWSPRDCSISALCVDELSQAMALQAMFNALYVQPWFQGFYLWMWRADVTAGGAGDDEYTPRGKLAAAVLDLWWK